MPQTPANFAIITLVMGKVDFHIAWLDQAALEADATP
jgi:hypothetical protein